ncbi:MAG: hypothetical protein HYX40_13065 [Sphingobacteriales bacterium]|nr:hypothetical protein [Sphingobacteriales bacterium]
MNGVADGNIKTKIRSLFNNSIYIGFLIIFLLPFFSGLWSRDVNEWWTRIAVKLPFVLLPFGFFALDKITKQHFILLSRWFVLLMIFGSAWSGIKYLQNTAYYHDLYLRAQVIPTPFDNNHIYFSFSIVISLLLLVKLLFITTEKIWKWMYSISAAWLIIYLHILSAKTGLLCLYLSVLMLAVYFLLKTKNKVIALATIVVTLSFPIIAYQISPNFKNRIGYVLYDFNNYSKGNYIEGLSDGNRYLSLKAGWDIFKTAPYSGVGFGDIWSDVDEWNKNNRPQIKEYERMLPSSEVFLYACGVGIAGAILFFISLVIPLFVKHMQRDITWICFHAITIFFLLYEVTLEAQFGVFVYVFFTCWWQQFTSALKTTA